MGGRRADHGQKTGCNGEVADRARQSAIPIRLGADKGEGLAPNNQGGSREDRRAQKAGQLAKTARWRNLAEDRQAGAQTRKSAAASRASASRVSRNGRT